MGAEGGRTECVGGNYSNGNAHFQLVLVSKAERILMCWRGGSRPFLRLESLQQVNGSCRLLSDNSAVKQNQYLDQHS